MTVLTRSHGDSLSSQMEVGQMARRASLQSTLPMTGEGGNKGETDEEPVRSKGRKKEKGQLKTKAVRKA